MILKILFWSLVALDASCIVLFGLLGLAAAGPSHTNPIGTRIHRPASRRNTPGCRGPLRPLGIARLEVARVRDRRLPVPVRGRRENRHATVQLAAYRDGTGSITQFRDKSLREIEQAIASNDAAAVARSAQGAPLNQPGLSGATVLMLALRELDKHPGDLEVLRALIKAGADPKATRDDVPLSTAIAATRHSGMEPVKLLLEAGADPNQKGEYSGPAYFIAGGAGIHPDALMKLMLDHGADLKLREQGGNSALHTAVLTENWKVGLLLVEKGVDFTKDRGPGGLPLLEFLESQLRTTNGDKQDLIALIQRMKSVK